MGRFLQKKKRFDSSSVNFHKYLEAYNITQPQKKLTVNELKDAFVSLKLNKSPSLHKPLLHIFNASLQNGIFPHDLKIARVAPLFKNGSDSDLRNYRPISVSVKKIMCNCLYKHLIDNNIL